MNTNATETTASILEEMRKGDKCDFPFAYRFAYCDAPAVVDVSTKDILEPTKVRIIKVTIDELADRLEKAIARETKNTAAMYEALEAFVQLADDGVIQPRIYGEAEHHCFCALQNQVAAALSAPIRNCDRYKTRTDAVKAYLHEAANGTCETNQFVDWLFATIEKGVENA